MGEPESVGLWYMDAMKVLKDPDTASDQKLLALVKGLEATVQYEQHGQDTITDQRRIGATALYMYASFLKGAGRDDFRENLFSLANDLEEFSATGKAPPVFQGPKRKKARTPDLAARVAAAVALDVLVTCNVENGEVERNAKWVVNRLPERRPAFANWFKADSKDSAKRQPWQRLAEFTKQIKRPNPTAKYKEAADMFGEQRAMAERNRGLSFWWPEEEYAIKAAEGLIDRAITFAQ